jgi:BASS family bile acid:Na+ symporter
LLTQIELDPLSLLLLVLLVLGLPLLAGIGSAGASRN